MTTTYSNLVGLVSFYGFTKYIRYKRVMIIHVIVLVVGVEVAVSAFALLLVVHAGCGVASGFVSPLYSSYHIIASGYIKYIIPRYVSSIQTLNICK